MANSSLWKNASSTISSYINATSKLPGKIQHLPDVYAEYVASNVQSVGQVESTLRSLTYLLPGARLNDSELASESVHTFVQILSIYHDHLLKKRSQAASDSITVKSNQSKVSHHARYTTFWSDSSSLYTKAATMLKVVQYTELLLEMAARRRGGTRGRWRMVVLLESLKALLRLVLLRLTDSRPVISPPLPLREDFAPADQSQESEDDMQLLDPMPYEPNDVFGESGIPTPPMSDSDKIPNHINHTDAFCMPRTGFSLPLMPSPDAISSYLLEHVITPDDIKPVQQLVHQLTSFRGQAAEILHILRPLIYALLMQRVARRYGYEGDKWKRVWTPWLAGLAIEYFAKQLAKSDVSSKFPGSKTSSALETEEATKRNWNLSWWGMRGAFYENVTKNAIGAVANTLKGKPVLDLVGGVIEDYEHLWGNYYFSTSTM